MPSYRKCCSPTQIFWRKHYFPDNDIYFSFYYFTGFTLPYSTVGNCIIETSGSENPICESPETRVAPNIAAHNKYRN